MRHIPMSHFLFELIWYFTIKLIKRSVYKKLDFMGQTSKVDLLFKKFNEPFQIDNVNYYLGKYLYLSMISIEGKEEYKISYYSKKPPKSIRVELIRQLFRTFNELKIIPHEINYTVPDNQLNTKYFSYSLSLEKWNVIPVKNDRDGLLIKMAKNYYLDFYRSRYHRTPIVSEIEDSHNHEFEHAWISHILIYL